jgi:beta-aspartyl-peptidase (threonine type)
VNRRAAGGLLAASLFDSAGLLGVSRGAGAAEACRPDVYQPDGRHVPALPRGPGLVLSGAGAGLMPVAALHWMRARFGTPAGRAGNVVVLRASGERDDTDDFYREGRFASVQEILIPPCATRADVDAVARYVDLADGVFFAGGDQAHYAAWKGSALIAAVQRVYARGGIVGGGSAGLAIQGAIAFDSVAADRIHGDTDYGVTTGNTTREPLEPEISFTTGLFAWPPLRDTITDTHFVKRDRFGRLVAFLARIVHGGLATTPYYGLGIDEGSVVLVDGAGRGVLRRDAKSRGAYVVRLREAVALPPGRPLHATVDVARVARDGEVFDLGNKRVAAPWKTVTVNGAANPRYSEDPYA